MKTLVVLVTHIFNDFVADRYKDLERSLLDDFDLVLAHSNVCEEEDYFEKHNIKHVKLPFRDDQLDERNERCPNNGKFFIDVYSMFNKFDYYWFIEYDVMMNTDSEEPFKKLFKFFHDEQLAKDADLVADHVNTYVTNNRYNCRYPFEEISTKYKTFASLGLTKKDIHFAFYTICRLSNRLLSGFSSNADYVDLFFEWGITTYAYMHDMQICNLKNLFTVSEINQHVIDRNNVNRGSNSWSRKTYKKTWEEYPNGCIIHPIKNY